MSSNGTDFYLIAGSDYFQQTESKKILDAVEDCETEIFSSDDFTQENFFNFINSPSLFQENKAAVVKSANKIKDLADVIAKCAMCRESHLIFLSSEPKTDKALTKALKDAGFNVSTEKKASKYDQAGRVLKMFMDAGFKIDSASAAELNEIFEGDLNRVASEIEKLSLYFAYKKPQSASEIMNAVTARKQDSIFSFIDAFTARKRKPCIILLDGFISSGENLNILINLLFRRMKDVYLCAELKDQLKENRPWMLEKIRGGARAWKHEDLLKLFGLYAELDYKNKTGQVTPENYLTALISAL